MSTRIGEPISGSVSKNMDEVRVRSECAFLHPSQRHGLDHWSWTSGGHFTAVEPVVTATTVWCCTCPRYASFSNPCLTTTGVGIQSGRNLILYFWMDSCDCHGWSDGMVQEAYCVEWPTLEFCTVRSPAIASHRCHIQLNVPTVSYKNGSPL